MSYLLKGAVGSTVSELALESSLQPAASSLVTIPWAGSESQECTHGDLKEMGEG